MEIHHAHTSDNEVSRRLLSCLVSSFSSICRENGSFTSSFAMLTHTPPAKDMPLRGKHEDEWEGRLAFAVLPPGTATAAHNQRTGAKKGGHKSWGGVDHTTRDSLIFPGLLSINVLCPPSTAMSSENNIKF